LQESVSKDFGCLTMWVGFQPYLYYWAEVNLVTRLKTH